MKYLLLLVLLSCKNKSGEVISLRTGKDTGSEVSIKRNISAIDVHDPYQTGKDTVRLNAAMDQIFKFPEVQAVDRQINKNSKGTHGVSIMVRDEFEYDTTYYDFMVGDNSHQDRYVNIFNFVMKKKTGQIKGYDAASDSIMSLIPTC